MYFKKNTSKVLVRFHNPPTSKKNVMMPSQNLYTTIGTTLVYSITKYNIWNIDNITNKRLKNKNNVCQLGNVQMEQVSIKRPLLAFFCLRHIFDYTAQGKDSA